MALAISTFSPPIKATAVKDSLPRILVAIGTTPETGDPYFVGVDGDGTVELLLLGDVTVNWRYDPKTELWEDSDTGAPEQAFGDSDGGE